MSTAILSIDGGGMKGIVSAVFLDNLERHIKEYSKNPNARIGDYFDLIAGTSTGSILTVFYLLPENGHPKYSAHEILNFYLTLGPSIFDKQSLFPLFGSKYTSHGFEEQLTYHFGNIKLSELLKPCLITSYNTSNRSAVFFNRETARKDPIRNLFLKDAVRASCAAPTYFPPVCFSKSPNCLNCYIDGGIVANNPSFCAVIEALKMENCKSLHDIYVCSVGNVKNEETYTGRDIRKWGLLEWAVPLFSLLLNSNVQKVDYQMKKLFDTLELSDHYLRFQMNSFTKTPAMDDYSDKAIDYLLSAGEELVETYQVPLKRFAKWLVFRS